MKQAGMIGEMIAGAALKLETRGAWELPASASGFRLPASPVGFAVTSRLAASGFACRLRRDKPS